MRHRVVAAQPLTTLHARMADDELDTGRRDRAAHRRRDDRGLRPPLPALPRDERRREAALRGRRVAGGAAGGAGAHPLLRRARRGMRRAAARRARRRLARRRDLAQREAALHRPARRPQAARARRDVLQLGRHAGAAAHVRPQRLRLRAGRGLDRVHRVGSADLPQLLPRRARACGPRCSRSSPTSAGAGRSPTSSATSTSSCAPCSSTSTASGRRPSPNYQLQVLGSAFYRNKAAYVIGKIVNGDAETAVRRSRAPRRRRPARARHGPVRRRGHLGPLLALARVLHGRHGRARRATSSSCRR